MLVACGMQGDLYLPEESSDSVAKQIDQNY